jgi:short-subunit dehydrogenase
MRTTDEAVTAVVTGAAGGIGQALADSPVRVTMICPALVRTGMSPEGADPADVAAAALRALDDDVFAVVPAPWRAAVVAQAGQVVAGHQPAPPTPAD